MEEKKEVNFIPYANKDFSFLVYFCEFFVLPPDDGITKAQKITFIVDQRNFHSEMVPSN